MLPLVVTTAHTGAPLATNRVDFVDENDARAVFLGPLKEVPDPGSAHAHEHFHKLGTREGEKGHTGLSGNGLGQQGFTRSRGADKQHALGDFRAHGGEALRGFQEGDHFLEVLFGLLNAGNVIEFDARFSFHRKAGLGLAELHRLARPPRHAIGATGQENERANQQKREEQIPKQAQGRRRRLGGVNVKADALVLELVHQLRSNPGEIHPQALNPVIEIGIHRLDHGTASTIKDVHRGHPAGIHVIEEAAVAHAGNRRIAGGLRGGVSGATGTQSGGSTRAEQLPSQKCDHCKGQQPEGNQAPALVHN